MVNTPNPSLENDKDQSKEKISSNKIAEDLKKGLLEEKPSFRATRKAIKIAAESMASREFLDAPEQRHIDAVISNYRMLHDLDPKSLNVIINLTVKGKEVSDEMGSDLRAIFDQVRSKELTATMSEDLDAAITTVHKTKTLTDDDMEKEIIVLAKRYLEGKAKQLREDPRIISAFAGKEALLDKVLDFAMSSADIAQSLAKDID